VENIPFLLFAGMILCVFFLVSFTSQKFRLPSVLVYIVLGAAVSTFFHDIEAIHTVAEIGIVLLFFILGLEFPLARMVSISKKSGRRVFWMWCLISAGPWPLPCCSAWG
jgi:monovalent cation:H+ antiporter-2, CPA2 family